MGMEDIGKMCRGQCSSCGFRMLFWSKDEANVICLKCGSEHEVERGEALNLGSGETSEVALLVLVKSGERKAGRASESEN
jgi:hypothetical protein